LDLDIMKMDNWGLGIKPNELFPTE